MNTDVRNCVSIHLETGGKISELRLSPSEKKLETEKRFRLFSLSDSGSQLRGFASGGPFCLDTKLGKKSSPVDASTRIEKKRQNFLSKKLKFPLAILFDPPFFTHCAITEHVSI
jgi:hypothetical protein